jgi:hypothetical protein
MRRLSLSPEIFLIPFSIIVILSVTSNAYCDELGSSITLEQLQAKPRSAAREQLDPPLTVQPAAEPVPALKLRLYPASWTLKPGSALLHFCRAQIVYRDLSRDQRQKVQTEEWLDGTGEGEIPSDEEVRKMLISLEALFTELHALAMSEDFKWDHRIRDLRGPDIFAYRLMDVQEVRALARMLVLRMRIQLADQDFVGFISSAHDGLRLAEFVGQGETLIQKLVGIAIATRMRQKIEQAIATPGCPNLYWALATVPQHLIRMGDSVLWELSNPSIVLTELAEAESESWTEAQAAQKWSALLEKLGELSGSEADNDRLQIMLAIAGGTLVGDAKSRLAANGYATSKLTDMPGLQILLIDAAQELRRMGDEVGKAHLLPAIVGKTVAEREEKELREWLSQNRSKSVAALIAGQLFPAVRQAKEAETRRLMRFNRTLTLEAIRMHAAEHQGELPESLEQLSPVPALPDPYTGKAFDYSVQTIDGKQTISLKSAGFSDFKRLQTLRASFGK